MPTNGKSKQLFVQPKDDTNGALVIANLTENSHSIENELMDEQTKMGRILEYGNNNESFEITAYGEKGDAGQQAVLDAIRNKKRLNVWEVDVSAEGPYPATFAEVLVESIERSSASDSFEEVSATLQVNGESVEGELTALPAGFDTATTTTFQEPATGA